jgi:hypothetical protein
VPGAQVRLAGLYSGTGLCQLAKAKVSRAANLMLTPMTICGQRSPLLSGMLSVSRRISPGSKVVCGTIRILRTSLHLAEKT